MKKITIKEKVMVTIKICLGSSCFARGNDSILAFLQEKIKEKNLSDQVEVFGCRCNNLCTDGPNIFVNGEKYSHISKENIEKILEAI